MSEIDARTDHQTGLRRSREGSDWHERGRNAEGPSQIPMRGLRDVFWRVYTQINQDRIPLIAAGVTFYLLLSLFPAMAALVSLYGLVADPVTISSHISFLAAVFPQGSFDLILSQLTSLVQQKGEALSLGFISGLLIALWSANNGIKALFDAMNIAYGEQEKRGLIAYNLMSLAFTLGALLIAVATIFAVGVLPVVLSYLWLDRWTELVTSLVRWPILLLLIGTAIVLLYRYGPSRNLAKLRWLSWGATGSTLLWILASILFSYYLNNFADYNATYGTLGALIGFLVWIWISVIIVIIGAEVNAELEHQTQRDSTTGAPRPMGERGAHVADTLGKAIGS